MQYIGYDSWVDVRFHLGRTLAILGYADKARKLVDEAIKRGESLARVRSIAVAQYASLNVGWILRDYTRISTAAAELHKLATKHNLAYYEAVSRFHLAWLDAEAGNTAAGIKGMREAIAWQQRLGHVSGTQRKKAMLASAHHKAGEIQEGLRGIEEALSLVETTSERDNEAEIRRLKGEMLRSGKSPRDDEAEATFIKAIKVAQDQKAKTWELRATISLARLWCEGGRQADARDVLAPVYAWFTEGARCPRSWGKGEVGSAVSGNDTSPGNRTARLLVDVLRKFCRFADGSDDCWCGLCSQQHSA
jgi:predicted ATPase